ncbi:class II glutamine amidotransferase [Salinibius halmophilus]|uniref:class II glutamine amidotransferase n=1 Tax=Salinibius halmophilus TaxID=1853216 RepID=UPI000E66C886|nr:class II glutamine amidotransferase [Salinibius halmophilus]
MCELLAMSANTPTDIRFSFAGLRQRGGRTGPHRDGWGLGFFEAGGLRCFHDPLPASESKIAELLSQLPIKVKVAIAHIRQANVGAIELKNTHPFQREVNGKYWCYAHNGQLADSESLVSSHGFQAVGTTDSERAFCWLLNQAKVAKIDLTNPQSGYTFLKHRCDQLRRMGVFNMLLSDGDTLYCYCTTKLHWITRRAPFGQTHLSDVDWQVNFAEETSPKDVVTIIATQPLTLDEQWHAMQAGELTVWQQGEMLKLG